MAIITLTTDFGEKDHFAGAVKGAIYSELEDVKIVDISHCVSPFHIMEAAYIIQNAYSSFPPGTIHIIGIDSELNPENKHIAVLLDGHYFICANNGIISMLANEINPQKIVEINIHDRIITNFPVLDVFVKVACHIARGGTLEVIGKQIDVIKELRNIRPTINQEANLVEYQLRVARAAGRRNRAATTNTEVATTTVVNRNKNNFCIGDIVRITNKYRVHEQGAEGTVTSVTSAYVNLRNDTSGTTYRRHWRNLLLITATA